MTSALLVVDVQNGFCDPGGSVARLGMGLAGVDAAVANAARAVEDARATDTPVVFTRQLYRPGRADEGTNMSAGGLLASVEGLVAGTWDAEVVDELGWTPADLTVDKCRLDAFLWTSLDPLLRGLGATDLLVCGVVTNLCVESTVRAAFMRDYRVTLLADACAARTARLHDLGVEVMRDCGLATIGRAADALSAARP